MISFSEFNTAGILDMSTENLESHLTEEQIISLNENLGNLKSLGAGKMISVFKQTASIHRKDLFTGADDNRFARKAIGQGSGIKDIGKISSWKDIRKVVNASSKNDEAGYVGAVVYYNDKAYATINFQGPLDKIGVNDVFIVAADSSVLPDSIGAKVLAVASKNKSRWNPENQTGGALLARELESIVDAVVSEAKDNGGKVTAKLIQWDRDGYIRGQERKANRISNDPLETREAFGKRTRHFGSGSLTSDLAKYKAGKRVNFNSKTDASKILMAMVNNPGSEISVDGKLFYATPDSYSPSSVDDLIMGKPVKITLKGPEFHYVSIEVTLKDFKHL